MLVPPLEGILDELTVGREVTVQLVVLDLRVRDWIIINRVEHVEACRQ